MAISLIQNWIQKKIIELGSSIQPYNFAALLHIYSGTLNLSDISSITNLNIEELSLLRKNAAFMKLVDTYKKECAKSFIESILINDRDINDYAFIAADFSMLDEIIRMQIKIPLFTYLKDLYIGLKNKYIYKLKMDRYDLMVFKRLYIFFLFTELYIETLTTKSLLDMKEIAEGVILPALNIDIKQIESILYETEDIRLKRLEELKSSLLRI